jgi:hypothetical protein
MAPKQVTIRGVSPELGDRLTAIARARGQSVNTTVLQILESAAGLDERRAWLRRFMTWTPEDVRAQDAATKAQRNVDSKLWK